MPTATPITPITPIAHTACALLALRTLGLYTDSPFPQHDYLQDPVSLGLACLVVALLTLRWWMQGPQPMEVAATGTGTGTTDTAPTLHAPALDAPLAQLKAAMWGSFWYLGYWFPHRKVAAILQESHPKRSSATFPTHFSLYQVIVRIRHFLLAHGLAVLIAAYALCEGEAFIHGTVVQALGPSWMLLCWNICIYSGCWLLLGAAMALRRHMARG